jgi:hypothetical protein
MATLSKEERTKVLSALGAIRSLVEFDGKGDYDDTKREAMFRSASNFGPERNAPLNFAWSERFEVPPGKRAICRFSFNAWFENAIMLYDVSNDYQLIAERGNYSRPQDEVELRQPGIYIITGWHKNSPPRASSPWFQSPKRVFVSNPRDLVVGFEDAGQDDYDDGLITVTFRDA